MDSPTMIINSFKIPVIKTWKHFHHFLFFFHWSFIPSLETSARFRMTKNVKQKPFYFMQMLDIKMMFTSFKKVHSKMKTFINKRKKNAPSWSFILTLLMTIEKFSEFGRICVDKKLNLVFEDSAILRGMPSTLPWYPRLAFWNWAIWPHPGPSLTL